MTIGDRIAQVRKEHGLSQEAFGESLGVTRQSISKWEANLSIPEVEKLLAISKLYHVSVGWLLGEEAQDKKGEQALTEEQLRMVERIAEKYIASMPKSQGVKKSTKVFWTIGICVVLIWCFVMSGELSNLTNQYYNIQNNLGNIQSNVSSDINGIASRVEEILKQQNHLLADYHAEIVKTEIAKDEITFSVSAVPKNYVEGMKVEFLFECDGELHEIEGIESAGNKFTCEARVPLAESINVSAVLSDGATEQTQLLEVFEGIESGTKIQFYSTNLWIWGTRDKTRDRETIKYTLALPPTRKWLAEDVYATEVMWRIFVDDECVEEISGELSLEKDNYEQIAAGRLDYKWINELTLGQEFYCVTVVTDNFDRTYVVGVEGYVLEEDNFLEYSYSDISYDDPFWLE